MPTEKPLHIGRKFAENIPNYIRTQGAAKAIHGVPERSILSQVASIV
jgi:hypothetical protein